MEKFETQPSTRSLIIVAVLAAAFSSFTLWLIESWIKYPLFLFEILTIIVLYLIVSGYDFKLTIKHIRKENVHVGLIIDAFLIVSALSLLIINASHVQGGLIQLILALLVTSLLSGYALLTIFGLTHYFTKLENIVLSHIISYIFTGLVTLILLPINAEARTLIVLSSYIVLGLISALKRRKQEAASPSRSFSMNIDFLALLLAMAFYAISFYFTYPGFALLPGTDISRHYASSIVLSRTPDLYISLTYLLAHLHESMFLSLSSPSLVSAQTALVTLNLMLPLAFYVMAKPYLERIDTRLPSLATLFWVLFTNLYGGFAWLHFVNLKLATTSQTQLQLLETSADKTIYGTIYGIFGLWYYPNSIALVILMTLIFLLYKKEIPTSKYLFLFCVMTSSLYLTHVVEAVVFALFLAVYGVLSRSKNLRIDDSIKSSIIGFSFVIVIYYIFLLFSKGHTFALSMSSFYISLFAPILALLVSLGFRRIIKPRLPSFATKLRNNSASFLKTLVLIILFAYIVAFLTWTSVTESFHTGQVATIGLVPWFMYPLMLGMNGLLAIAALYHFTQNMKSRKVLTLFIAFMIFAFIAGKAVSIINLHFFNTGYYERRLMCILKLPVAILAPIPVLLSIDRLKEKNININVKTVGSIALIGTVVLYGISTSFLNFEYWSIMANDPAYHPSSSEMNAINAFKKILDNDPKAWLATITSTSAGMATFAAPADMLGYKQILYTSKTPEETLNILYRHPELSHPYLYIHNRDCDNLQKYNCYLDKQLIQMLPIALDNPEVVIYNISKVVPPVPCSDTVLVIPADHSLLNREFLFSYNILSQGLYNYTVAYDSDENTIAKAETIVVPFDPPKNNIIFQSFSDDFNVSLERWLTIKGDWMLQNGSLVGGKTGYYSEGIIMSPVWAENFTATFKVAVTDLDPKVNNHFGLVYSWRDPENYRIALIRIRPDGYMYALIRLIENGVYSPWKVLPYEPGNNTGIEWKAGGEYEIIVKVEGELNEISINGKEALRVSIENAPGSIGLYYLRPYHVEFKEFNVHADNIANWKEASYYFDLASSGKTIVILNSNGFNAFSDMLFTNLSTCINVSSISNSQNIMRLPDKIKVPLMGTNALTLSFYASASNVTSPFTVETEVGDGRLIYINVYPLFRELDKKLLYPLLGDLLSIGGVRLSKFKMIPIIKYSRGYVKEIQLRSIDIKTTYLSYSSSSKSIDVHLTKGIEFIEFNNVTSFTICCPEIILSADCASVGVGQGLYAETLLNGKIQVAASDSNAEITLTTGGERLKIDGVSQMALNLSEPLAFYLRTPHVNASEAVLREVYVGLFSNELCVWGQDVVIEEGISINLLISDTYQFVEITKIFGSMSGEGIMEYDAKRSNISGFLWAIISFPFFLFFTLLPKRESN